MLKLWINSLIYQKLEEHLFYRNTYFTILHMWLQQHCHIWGERLYNNSSRLETVNYCRKEFHLKCSWFLGPPLFINITVSLAAKFSGNVSLFTITTYIIPKTVQTAWLHEKMRLKNGEKWNKKFNLFLCQSGWTICMLLCYKVTRKSFLQKTFLF